jgi:hypothetical protein
MNAVGELAARRNGFLRLVRHAVVAVLQPQAVPVHGGVEVGVVADMHDDLRTLPHSQDGPGIEPL